MQNVKKGSNRNEIGLGNTLGKEKFGRIYLPNLARDILEIKKTIANAIKRPIQKGL